MKYILATIALLLLLTLSLSCTPNVSIEEYNRVKDQRDKFNSEVAGLIREKTHLEYEYERIFKNNQQLQDKVSQYIDTYGELYSYPTSNQAIISENISLSLVPVSNPNIDNPKLAFKGATDPIVLINNKQAQNPSYNELLSFLKRDKTDTYFYNFGDYPVFTAPLWGDPWHWVDIDFYKEWINLGYHPFDNKQPRFDTQSQLLCGDFAELLHNNSELAGIKSAIVSLVFTNGDTHALNAFKTTDKGLLFIDSTGGNANNQKPNGWRDKIAHVEIGDELTLSPIEGNAKYLSLPKINSIVLQWD